LAASAVTVLSGIALPRTLLGTAAAYYALATVIRWSIGGWAVARLRGATLAPLPDSDYPGSPTSRRIVFSR